MADQTPSTEQVRYGYRTGVTAPILPVEAVDAFDAWLAARDREVAAKALRAARDDWRKGAWAGADRHADRGRDRFAAAQYAGNWLHDRANRIEAGDE